MIVRRFRRDERGVATIEMALTLPIVVVFFYGIFQLGAIMAADAGMQHGLGEGARMATLFPTPSNSTIASQVAAKSFSVNVGTIGTPTITNSVGADGNPDNRFIDMSITYTVTPNFLLFNGPAITMTRTKRVYRSF
ncbi:MAG: pilus assembly protein [Sphingomonas sp.]|uniref:TadE/TadG family type IV pilus assembly protein n=1 Tax=Sphingomonas sp. TaxID=28214 RepID=UPI0017A1E72D|nr:TadE/TadG family type IV pilus assembly protein [Sphingomonas sp.]MBA3667744.1 pilus assembly protein [Sphingomonas sp.]